MENTQNNVNEINESIAKTPLDKNIKKTIGGTLFLITTILITGFTCIFTFYEMVRCIDYAYNCNIFASSIIWVLFILLRVVPNILLCVSLWLIHLKAANENCFSKLGCIFLRVTLLIKMCVCIIVMISGILIVCLNEFDKPIYYQGYNYSVLAAQVLSISFIVICLSVLFVLYLFTYLTVSSLTNYNRPIKFMKTTPILAIVFGALVIINLLFISKLIDFYFQVFSNTLLSNELLRIVSTFFNNYFSIFVHGAIALLYGIVGVQYIYAMKKLQK